MSFRSISPQFCCKPVITTKCLIVLFRAFPFNVQYSFNIFTCTLCDSLLFPAVNKLFLKNSELVLSTSSPTCTADSCLTPKLYILSFAFAFTRLRLPACILANSFCAKSCVCSFRSLEVLYRFQILNQP
jgi:hypothetical protein